MQSKFCGFVIVFILTMLLTLTANRAISEFYLGLVIIMWVVTILLFKEMLRGIHQLEAFKESLPNVQLHWGDHGVIIAEITTEEDVKFVVVPPTEENHD